MVYKYGEFTDNQISQAKNNIRKSIFFLLLCVDPNTCDEYRNVDVNKAFEGLMYKLGGMNHIFVSSSGIVNVMSSLQAAWDEYNSSSFSFKVYRKLILDAGAEIMRIGGDEDD